MLKKIKNIIFILILLFINIPSTLALTGTVNVNDSLTLRDAPSTSGNKITGFYNGTIVNIIDTNAGVGNGCDTNWYKVEYNNYTGYSCGKYIVVNNEGVTNDTEDKSYVKDNYNKAPSKDGTIMCYGSTGSLGLRNKASGTKTGAVVDCGEEVNILEVVETPSITCPYWYKIERNNDTGYVCGYYVNTTKLSSTAKAYYESTDNEDTIENYKTKLTELGFPESYHPYLLELHARHPNWNFISEKLPMKFGDAIVGESGMGASLLQGSAFNHGGYLSTASHTYNLWTDTYSSYESEPGYYNASLEAIAYYMDPRNYLNEKYIFAFETLGYSQNQTPSVISSIIGKQDFWPTIYKYYEKEDAIQDSKGGASDDIVDASSTIGISAVHVASRIKQEITGLNTTDSRIGGEFTYNGVTYSNYYNFFNIKSRCKNCSSIYSGYAFEKSWNTPYKGIYGGASFMYDGYISLNQDTIYYEKFDVSTTDGHYTHQYMQNLAAPIQEAGIKYNGYIEGLASYLDTEITFVIPVYDDMPLYAVTAPRIGSSNNYLKDLTINGVSVSNFNYNTYNYNVYLNKNTTSVDIGTSTIVKSAKVSGDGTIEITNDNQTNQIIVISENGKTRTYNINFTREISEETTIEDTMKNSGFKYNDTNLFGINIGTNVTELIGNISGYNHTVEVSIKDKDGNLKTNDIFKTGDTVTIKASDGEKKYNILIYGDANGDGKISAIDYVNIKNYILKAADLNGVYATAADVNKDGNINAIDYVQIKNNILGKNKIEQ